MDGSVGELVPGMVDASVAEVDQAAAPAVGGPCPARSRLCSVSQSGLGADLTLASEDAEKDRLVTDAAPTPDAPRRSFPRRTAGAGPRRSLKAYWFAGRDSGRSAAWRAVGGEAAHDLADSGLGNSRTLGVPVFIVMQKPRDTQPVW